MLITTSRRRKKRRRREGKRGKREGGEGKKKEGEEKEEKGRIGLTTGLMIDGCVNYLLILKRGKLKGNRLIKGSEKPG